MIEINNLKTLEGQFLLELQNDFGLTPVVSHALLKRSKEIMGGLSYLPDNINVGQMKALAVSAKEPAGKPLANCKIIPIIITVDAGKEDLETLQESGAKGLRRVVLSRITDEAVNQGACLTEEDAARILRCDVRTIKRDVKYFRNKEIYIPLRGHMINTGRGQTHKMAIVKWYIQGMTFTDIKMRTHHSTSAISRYLDTFSRIVILIRRNLTSAAIAQVVSISKSLVEEYLKLYYELNIPEYQDQLNRIVNRIKIPKESEISKKRRDL